ncbi:MAG: helicase, partial [Myxococcales bacterium]|nr:helicase [Myxococcales bacterium]
ASVGLGEFCLPIYDSAAANHGERSRVLAALSRVLERSYRAIRGPTTNDARVAELRTALDGYVGALHNVGPLGLSIHEVIGRLVDLRTAPRAALAETDAPALDRATFERRKQAAVALARAAQAVEPVANHPWRISALPAWPADAATRASEALDQVTRAADTLAAAIGEVAALVPGIVAKTPEQVRSLGALAELASASPRPGVELLTNMRSGRMEDVSERVALIRARGGGTVEVPRDPASFLAVATRHRALAEEVDDRFTDAVDTLDAAAQWSQLKRWTDSMGPLRYVALRAVRTEVRAVAVPAQLETDGAMITALEAVIAERACRAALIAAAEPAKRWFGELGGDPLALDLTRIEAAVAWGLDLRRAFDGIALTGGEHGRQIAWRALVAQVAACSERAASTSYPTILRVGGEAELGAFARLADAVARWQPAIAELAAATGISEDKLGVGPDHLGSLRSQIEALRQSMGLLGDWTRYHLARREAIVAGVGPTVTAIDRGDLGAAELAAAWERATLLSWVDAELSCIPALARFSGAAHHTFVTAYADLDRGSLAFARSRALAKLGERVPRAAKQDETGELARLLTEAKSQTRRSLRSVLAELPTLLPKLAPCVLATPHAVARHLDPALPMFDVVVFDEASRLPTGRALGAIMRARAMVVVGDAHQLPPAHGETSLLDDALAARLPQLSLAAHYRSRHEDLFAFANRRYYGDRLQLLPAAHHSPDLGVSLRLVDSARAEAEAIVAELAARLHDPAQRTRSLAVVALSRAQRVLIEDTLDEARAADPEFDALIEQAHEPLLIGTPDRMQGEERDVVLLSIGGGASALALTGAERWLGVAITRARDQMITFSSVGPEAAPEAAHELIALLSFAKVGGGAGRSSEATAPATSITAAIARALSDRGWIVRHQVGCGPFTIDLAVVDPNDPDRYVLAIEHDGTTYANSPVARDRDRLRAQRLGELGWRMHRIWALDWWFDAEREIQRAHGAIVAAIAASRRKRAPATASRPTRFARATSTPLGVTAPASRPELATGSSPIVAPSAAAVDLASGSGPAVQLGDATVRVRIKRGSIPIGPYTAALIPAGRRAPDDMFAARHLAELGKIVESVLAAEAPMHIDLLARRVGAYFGVGRVTERVLEQMLVVLEGRGKLGDEPGVVWRIDQDPASVPAVRVAGSGAEARRDIAEVPLAEVASAVRIVVERTHDVSATELVRDSARLLGFARLTDKVSDRVAEGVRLAAQRHLIAIEEGRAHLPD